MTSWIRALAGFARCERPTSASLSASSDQPGRLLQGPDEKNGRLGFVAGFMTFERRPKLGLRARMSTLVWQTVSFSRLKLNISLL